MSSNSSVPSIGILTLGAQSKNLLLINSPHSFSFELPIMTIRQFAMNIKHFNFYLDILQNKQIMAYVLIFHEIYPYL